MMCVLMRGFLAADFEHNNISFLHDILFSFETKKSFLSCLSPTTRFDKFLHAYHFCFDEFFFEVSVNDSGRLRRTRSLFNRSCTCLFFTSRKVVHESECIEREGDHIIQGRHCLSGMHVVDELFSLLC